jgi:hypothetical protein
MRCHKKQPGNVEEKRVGKVDTQRENVKQSFVKDKLIHQVAEKK